MAVGAQVSLITAQCLFCMRQFSKDSRCSSTDAPSLTRYTHAPASLTPTPHMGTVTVMPLPHSRPLLYTGTFYTHAPASHGHSYTHAPASHRHSYIHVPASHRHSYSHALASLTPLPHTSTVSLLSLCVGLIVSVLQERYWSSLSVQTI